MYNPHIEIIFQGWQSSSLVEGAQDWFLSGPQSSCQEDWGIIRHAAQHLLIHRGRAGNSKTWHLLAFHTLG